MGELGKRNRRPKSLLSGHLGCVVVIALVVVAALMLVPTLDGGHSRPFLQVVRCEATVQGLCTALDVYKQVHHAYPPDRATGVGADLDKSSECLVYYLSGGSIYWTDSTPEKYPWRNPAYHTTDDDSGRKALMVFYMFNSSELVDIDGDGAPEIVDPWGNAFSYNVGDEEDGPFNQDGAPKHRPKRFDLSSAGPDGEFGTGDDITNWAE